MNIVGPPVYVGLNIYCWLKDKDNTSHWLRNIYGNLDYTRESEIYTEIMSVYGNLDYIRESGIYTEIMSVYGNLDYIRESGIYTEIMIVYGNQEFNGNQVYKRKLCLVTEIRILTEIRSINGIKNKTSTEIRKKETCSKGNFQIASTFGERKDSLVLFAINTFALTLL